MTFAAGSTIVKREVWEGEVWLEHPVEVESDDGPDGVLATRLSPGSPFTFPEHPRGPHPWSARDAWSDATVLMLRRPDDWYSVWKFFGAGSAFLSWYVNFETPVVRTADGVEVNDLQLDLVIAPDGTWRWKDVEHLAPSLASGRITQDELLATLAAAAEVADLLGRDDRWWAPWDDWAPEG